MDAAPEQPIRKGPPTFSVRLAAARKLAPAVRLLAFERVDGGPMVFEPGQWINLVLPLPEGDTRRAYSIASAPDGAGRFEVAVTRVEGGPGSSFLHDLDVGRELVAVGPQGFFTRPPLATHPSLFVGTGTGVTPLRSMIHAALAAGSATPMRLLFGTRTPEDVLFADELASLAARHPNFRAECTLSRAPESWTGRRGYVQEHVKELWQELAAGATEPVHVYVCGLQRMVGAVRDLVKADLGATRREIHSERYD